MQASALLKDVALWCKEMSIYPIGRGKFYEYLKSKKYTKKMATFGEHKGSYFWHGIGLKTDGFESGRGFENGENKTSTTSTERPY